MWIPILLYCVDIWWWDLHFFLSVNLFGTNGTQGDLDYYYV